MRALRTCATPGAGLLLVACCAAPASAQEAARSFEELRLRVTIGDTIFVIDSAGLERQGRVEELSETSLRLERHGVRRDFDEGSVRRIDRTKRDPVSNGVLIGVASGALAGFLVGRSADSTACPDPRIECGQGAAAGTLGGAFWGGVGGWLIDALRRGREVVYQAPGRP